MTDSIEPQQPEDLASLTLQFREIKHSVNNALGVMMAMSELAQMNPNNVGKLIKVVLERGPKIVTQLQDFGNELQRLSDAENSGKDA